MINEILTLIGFSLISKFLFGWLRIIFVFYLAEPLRLGFNFQQRGLGTWACVTGASDGIGKGFAFQVKVKPLVVLAALIIFKIFSFFQLAAKGLNVILISRDRQKSLGVAQQIGKTYIRRAIRNK